MGSTTPTASLPSASSPSLTLTLAHEDERPKTWSLTHPMWGPALSHSEYLAREHFMTTLPLAKDGGLTHWILTDINSPQAENNNQRPILSSCETLRKHAVAARHDPSSDRVILTEGISHGIGSVFTDPQYRGKGYANRMMQELGKRLRTWQEEEATTLFSVLYSDIGKSFYAKNGWKAFPSAHVSFKPIKSSSSSSSSSSSPSSKPSPFSPATPPFPPNLSPISYHTLPPLCTLDTTHLLTQTLPTLARSNPSKTHVALLPDLDCLLWHLLREDFMTQHIFHRTPSVRGAIYSCPNRNGQRVWAVWTRSYYRGLESESIEGNHMHILRFVMEGVEDLGNEESLQKVTEDPETEKYLVEAFRAILAVAQREAAEWRVQDVQMWNPSPLVSRLIEKAGVEGGYEMVERDMDSIPSLMWYGAEGMEGGRTEDVEWVANEKYGWC
ncbi:hypothetical protein NEUTE1DRAFT_78329 [Neurospora tetrasperma FGSC 2508]|uniref:Uncharacterized protein n=1 Tax=Neurospora tetrasperma (strain FGSC 2508 / ATCC MYA-4615 / P0657) TaxID=510951 RepID=F8MHT9_NEUT8|nr:uncharacterized protein NEUTE1DRAFT_78329 [Neurospora tetrasperma FGSC 2508]EGO58848.1 hypothetical protein NEUTE1DRAFT_78329 [Neurospora tetrasperma FGSC 2508]EGZ72948.1 hypothetical protein NEUTE2DRAFT_106926 [Neurospora tetrasperma FGSC 2509]